MAKTKKTVAEAAVKPAVVETAAAVAAETEAKPVKKTTTVKKEAAAPKKSTAEKTVANVYVQFNGVEVSADALIEKAKELSGVKSPKSVDVYVKPEENKAYFVVDGVNDNFDLY